MSPLFEGTINVADLRAAISNLALFEVFEQADHDVYQRNRVEGGTRFDAVALDDLWDTIDKLAAKDGAR